jgi:hypothetical protein
MASSDSCLIHFDGKKGPLPSSSGIDIIDGETDSGETPPTLKESAEIYTRKSHNLSTRCVRNRFVASLSTSCKNSIILSSCHKLVTHNLYQVC